MPGYLTDPASYAAGIAITASGNISAPNVQSAIYELDSEKADGSSTTSALALKAPLVSPTFTGTLSASVANVSSNLTVDTNTLFVDAANNRVGIGTNSPSSILNVVGGDIVLSNSSQTNFVQLTSDGALELYKSNSEPYIDFKTTSLEDFDTRIQQHSNGLSFQTGGHGATSEKMKIDSAGRVTIPNQPAIYLDGNNPNWATQALGTTIKDFSVSFSRGNMSWDSSTGRITVPVSGYYYLHFQAYHATSSTGRVFIRKNGNSQVLAQFGSMPGDQTKVVSAIISASANDYFDVCQDAGSWQLNAYRGSLHTAMYCVFLG